MCPSQSTSDLYTLSSNDTTDYKSLKFLFHRVVWLLVHKHICKIFQYSHFPCKLKHSKKQKQSKNYMRVSIMAIPSYLMWFNELPSDHIMLSHIDKKLPYLFFLFKISVWWGPSSEFEIKNPFPLNLLFSGCIIFPFLL